MKKLNAIALGVFLLWSIGQAATVTVKTASYAVQLTDDGSTIIMNSASNLVVYLPSLPSDRAGFALTVQKRGAGNVTIQAAGADYIADSGLGQYVRNTTAGETWASVTLTYATANHWIVTAAIGAWATDVSTLGTGLTAPVSVANGGTGAATFALNGVLYGNAASALGVTAIGAEGRILRVGASPFVPAWTTAAYPATAGAAGKAMISDGTNWVADDVVSAVPTGLNYTTATRAFSLASGYMIPGAGTSGQVLMSAGASAPAWTTPTFSVTATAGNALIGDGTNWTSANILSAVPTGLAYTTATRALSLTPNYIIPGPSADSGYVLTSNGASAAPTWQSAAGGTTHAMLSATHTDSTASAVGRGDIITGQGSTAKWVGLAFPGTPTGKVLTASATDIEWSAAALGTAAFTATGDYATAGHNQGNTVGGTAVNSSGWTAYPYVTSGTWAADTTLSKVTNGIKVLGASSAYATITHDGTNTTIDSSTGAIILTKTGGSGAATLELSDGSSNYITLTPPSIAADYTLTLPTAVPGASNRPLVGSTAATLSWGGLIIPTGGTAFKLAAYTATDTLTELAAVGATGEFLIGNTAAIPSWANFNTIATTGTVTTGTWNALKKLIVTNSGNNAAVDLSGAGTCYGQLYTNAGNDSDTHYDLPAAVVGMCATYYVAYAGTITLDPNLTDQIDVVTGAAGDFYQSDNVIGSSITLACIAANHWIVIGKNGTWIEE